MRFGFSEEQEELRRVVRRFLEETSPLTEARRLMDTAEGYEPAVWKRLSQELALPAVHVPEAYGGQGFTFVELGIALEEMGRALVCAPYFGSAALGASAILNAANEVAWGAFRSGRIHFGAIAGLVEALLMTTTDPAPATIADVIALDQQTRTRAEQRVLELAA